MLGNSLEFAVGAALLALVIGTVLAYVQSGRNGTLWPDWTFAFRRRADRFDAGEYELTPARVVA
jgi:hypothetical protein